MPDTYLEEHHKEEIDAELNKIAAILASNGVSPQEANEVAHHTAEISAIAFKAGIAYAADSFERVLHDERAKGVHRRDA